MSEEQRDALGFIALTDVCRHLAEAAQTTKEATVRGIGPPHVAGAAPTIGAQRVEAAVVAHPVGRVSLDRIAAVVAQCAPTEERSRVVCDDRCHQVTRCALGGVYGLLQSMVHRRVLGREHRSRRTLGREVDGGVAHHGHLTRRVRGMPALSLESAKDLAIGAVVVFVVMAVISAWVIKHTVTKLLAVVLTAGLALGAWTQRSNLQSCAERAVVAASSSVSCTFFGTTIDVPAP